jgi:hypothetical protein
MKSQIGGIVNRRLCVLLLAIAVFVSAGVVEGRAHGRLWRTGLTGASQNLGSLEYQGTDLSDLSSGAASPAPSSLVNAAMEERPLNDTCTNGYSGPGIGNGQITFGGNTACNYETGIGTTAKLCYRFNGRRDCVYEVTGSNYGYTNSVRTTIPCQQSGTVEYYVIVTSNVAPTVKSPEVRSTGC